MANPNQQFEQVMVVKPPRSFQDLWTDIKFTCDMGPLYPTLCMEVLPGDHIKCTTRTDIRFQPLVYPVLHDVEVYNHYFYVPRYMLNKHSEAFMVEQDNEGDGPGQTPIPLPPHTYTKDLFDLNFLAQGELLDFLGFNPIQKHIYASSPDEDPTGQGRVEFYIEDDGAVAVYGIPHERKPSQRVQLAPMIGYQLIYDSYYKAENFVDSLDFDKIIDMSEILEDTKANVSDDDVVLKGLCTLRNRAWEKDLFTSSLPQPQKGVPAGISMSLDNLALQIYLRDAASLDSNNIPEFMILKNGEFGDNAQFAQMPNPSSATTVDLVQSPYGDGELNKIMAQGNGYPMFYNPHDSLGVRTTGANGGSIGFTIEELRFAYAKEHLKEDLMRCGSRMTEVIRSQFGVVPDDLTMNRPRYLGGGVQKIVFSEVLQTSESADGDSNSNKLGSFAGVGYSLSDSSGFNARFNDYGYIFCIFSMRPRSAYGQGLPRMFTKFDRYDYFWSKFSHLGEQPVLNGEVKFSYDGQYGDDGQGGSTIVTNPLEANLTEFGYQPIYHDYRYIPSRLAGAMRDEMADMHLNRLFINTPVLNNDFIEMDPRDFDHIFAVGRPAAGMHVLVHQMHDVGAIRPVPKYGNPVL